MIKYRVGDLLEAADKGDVEVIAHQCNCFCKGKSGIAPLIFEKYQNAMIADQETKEGDFMKMGNLSFSWDNLRDPKVAVFNLYGQYHWKHDDGFYSTAYWALFSALNKMAHILERRWGMYFDKPPVIGFPLIGCGLAGGDWTKVSNLIERAFENSPCEVIVYTLEKIEGLDYESS